jgi:hypothetical protein
MRTARLESPANGVEAGLASCAVATGTAPCPPAVIASSDAPAPFNTLRRVNVTVFIASLSPTLTVTFFSSSDSVLVYESFYLQPSQAIGVAIIRSLMTLSLTILVS